MPKPIMRLLSRLAGRRHSLATPESHPQDEELERLRRDLANSQARIGLLRDSLALEEERTRRNGP